MLNVTVQSDVLLILILCFSSVLFYAHHFYCSSRSADSAKEMGAKMLFFGSKVSTFLSCLLCAEHGFIMKGRCLFMFDSFDSVLSVLN